VINQKEAIILDLPGWEEGELAESAHTSGVLRAWGHEGGGELSLHFFPMRPNPVRPLVELNAIRDQYSLMADILTLHKLICLKFVKWSNRL
jgi:hypothetical protein